MHTIPSRLSAILTFVASHVKTDLPQTGDALDIWSDSVMGLAGLTPNDTYRAFIAQAMLHLDARKRRISKQDMVGALKRSIASQVAYNKGMELKAKAAAEIAQLAVTEAGADNAQIEQTTVVR